LTEKSYIAKENINIGDSSFVYWRTRKEIKFNNKTIKKKDVRRNGGISDYPLHRAYSLSRCFLITKQK
jgi:hypothetical protein